MTTIKCRKCGKVYPFDEKICPVCGYDIRKDETLSPRDRAALGLKSDSALFDETNKENMERWKNQTKEERLEEAWENRNKFEIRPRRTPTSQRSNEHYVFSNGYFNRYCIFSQILRVTSSPPVEVWGFPVCPTVVFVL